MPTRHFLASSGLICRNCCARWEEVFLFEPTNALHGTWPCQTIDFSAWWILPGALSFAAAAKDAFLPTSQIACSAPLVFLGQPCRYSKVTVMRRLRGWKSPNSHSAAPFHSRLLTRKWELERLRTLHIVSNRACFRSDHLMAHRQGQVCRECVRRRRGAPGWRPMELARVRVCTRPSLPPWPRSNYSFTWGEAGVSMTCGVRTPGPLCCSSGTERGDRQREQLPVESRASKLQTNHYFRAAAVCAGSSPAQAVAQNRREVSS